ncbi:MAG: hypothetical protein KDH88_05860 [Chromatiales bacterium]|nr:hypothetical protein [Chromatiales bacterium]
MLVALLSLLILAVGGYLLFLSAKSGDWLSKKAIGALVLTALGLVGIGSRSFVIVGADEVGHLKRVYLASDMPPGQVIALPGEKGPRAEVLPPGFHFMPFVRVLNELEFFPVVSIPEGKLGFLVAKDGIPLEERQYLAKAWTIPSAQMMDAVQFLTDGKGQKGPQLSVLTPGLYRLNRYLWDVSVAPALDVPTGHVAVIRSNIESGAKQECPDVIRTAGGRTGEAVATPVVPKGCIGVWNEPLPPGRYYLNPRAYVPNIVPTRLQTWTYKGGYTERKINLRVTDSGKVEQSEERQELPVPEGAADRAILVRVEGWTLPVEMRVVVQVHPKDAPLVVAAVGDLQKIEDNIITPVIRDILRTIGGDPKRRVLDFIEKRDEITALVEKAVATEAVKAGITIQEVRMGEPAIPPELLVARLREQLATQLEETYKQEQNAQTQRIEVERQRAQADQQPELVRAEIAQQAATYRREQLRLEGEGEKLKQMEIAQGQKAVAEVLGAERTLQLQMLDKILVVAAENPDIIKVPSVQVAGSGGLEGGAAVLGSLLGGSNLSRMLTEQPKVEADGAGMK